MNSQIDYAFDLLRDVRKGSNLTREQKRRMGIALETPANEVTEIEMKLEADHE